MKTVIILFAVILFACSEERNLPNVVRPFVDKFESEAAKRKIFISVDVNIFVGDFQKSYFDPNKETIYFDTTSSNWTETREELIMHELGHAMLNRDHDLSKLPNGKYKTVMGNFSNRITSGWSVDSLRYREKYYYDELFNPRTSAPSWD